MKLKNRILYRFLCSKIYIFDNHTFVLQQEIAKLEIWKDQETETIAVEDAATAVKKAVEGTEDPTIVVKIIVLRKNYVQP